MECPLCEPIKKTNWHFYGPDYIIMDCETCNVPMVVFRSHEEPPDHVMLRAIRHAVKMFPDREPDFDRRTYPGHPHFHMR